MPAAYKSVLVRIPTSLAQALERHRTLKALEQNTKPDSINKLIVSGIVSLVQDSKDPQVRAALDSYLGAEDVYSTYLK